MHGGLGSVVYWGAWGYMYWGVQCTGGAWDGLHCVTVHDIVGCVVLGCTGILGCVVLGCALG